MRFRGGLIHKVVGGGGGGRRSVECGRALQRAPHVLAAEDEAPALAPAASCSGVSSCSLLLLLLPSSTVSASNHGRVGKKRNLST